MTALDMNDTADWVYFDMMRAPGLVRLALEWRAPWEYGATLLASPWLDQAPEG